MALEGLLPACLFLVHDFSRRLELLRRHVFKRGHVGEMPFPPGLNGSQGYFIGVAAMSLGVEMSFSLARARFVSIRADQARRASSSSNKDASFSKRMYRSGVQ